MNTGIYVPNEYVYSIRNKYSDCFEMVASVHPYRKDALEELSTWGRLGIKVVKWLPPAMNIDPSHGTYYNTSIFIKIILEKCTKFYEVYVMR